MKSPARYAFILLILLLAITFIQAHWDILKTGKSLALTGSSDSAEKNQYFNYQFMVKDLTGKTVEVNRFKGKVIFLNIWATWCGPCRAEMGSIQQLYSKVNKKDIEFIMLSVDQPGQLQKVSNYVAGNQFSFPVFMPHGKLPEQLNVPSIPTTFVISKDGKIVAKKIGSTNFDTPEFKRYLEALASE
jgi:thiol-disulfide isomerase/thioredoxin